MVVVLAGEAFDVAAAQGSECLAVPWLVLTTNFMKLGRAHAIGQCPKGTAGVDLGELPVVADEHQLRFGPRGCARERGKVPSADHPGLVDDEHGVALQLRAVIKRVPKPRDRCRVHTRLVAQLAGGPVIRTESRQREETA